MDKTLEKATNLEQQKMQSVIKVALLCAQPNPENRPSMSNVLYMLSAEKIPSVPQIGERETGYLLELTQVQQLQVIPRGTNPCHMFPSNHNY